MSNQREGKDFIDNIIFLHKSLAVKIEKIQLEVDDTLSKFFTGTVLWFPTIQVHKDWIDYWHRILLIKTGVLTSKNVIKRVSIKLGEYSGNYLTTVVCIDKLKIEWKEYQVVKKDAAALRSAFLKDQNTRKAHHKRMSSEDMIKLLRKEQRSIQEDRDSRQIRGRNNKQPVLKAEITDFTTGSVRTVYTQEEIVFAAAESNLRRQFQTVDTAFRQPPLMDAFGPCADNEEYCLGVLDGTLVRSHVKSTIYFD